MKRIYILALTLALTLALCSCTGEGNSGTTSSNPPTQATSSNPTQATTSEPTQGQDGRGDVIDDPVPAGANDTIMQGVFYYELIETSEDYGDGISPREGAELVNNLLTDNGLYSGNEISAGQCVYISFDELARLTIPDFLLKRECYIYSVGIGTAEGGLMGDDYEVVYRMYVDRSGEKAAEIYDDSGDVATFDLVLYADFSAGSTEGMVLTETITLPVEHTPLSRWVIADILTAGLSEWTGLDFSLNDVMFEERGIIIDWSADSTLISGLGNQDIEPEFYVYDAVSLNWFMMDSLAETFKEAFEETTLYYCSDGESITFTNPEDMTSQGLPELPMDKPYEGSAFYVSHAESAAADDTDGRGDMFDDDADYDLAYWNGFDFGPNLTYAEEYEFQGDSGEYMNAAEAAKLTFDDAKYTGYIPDYSDSVEYTMTLVDIADIDGDECYVYRCDGEDGFAAGFAYAYQIGDIYMQGQGGQWVPIIWGDGGYDDYDDYGDSDSPEGDGASMDPADVNWWGEYNSINYVLGITNYNGRSFSFTIDGIEFVDSGVAALDSDNPYSAQYGEIVFTFDGVDTIDITGGDYAETYVRLQN